jgi:type IV pilus assembly protein PilW
LTLIELMIAMTISLVLMAGVLTIFQSTKVTRNLQDGLANLQESGRYALYLLVRDIRGAGFGGCAGMGPTEINVIADDTSSGPVGFSEDDVISGLNDVSSGTTVGGVSVVEGTDVIAVQGMSDANVFVNKEFKSPTAQLKLTPNACSIFEAGNILAITDCRSMDIFCATTVSACGGPNTTISHATSCNNVSPPNLSKEYGLDAFIMGFKKHTYFIRDTGRTNRAGAAVRGLYRQDVYGSIVELADGIEDMQVTYGVDTDGNEVVDRFIDAPAAGDPLWADVVMVRLSLLVSSIEDANTAPVPYTFVGVTNTPSDSRLRQEFASTITLRNRID